MFLLACAGNYKVRQQSVFYWPNVYIKVVNIWLLWFKRWRWSQKPIIYLVENRRLKREAILMDFDVAFKVKINTKCLQSCRSVSITSKVDERQVTTYMRRWTCLMTFKVSRYSTSSGLFQATTSELSGIDESSKAPNLVSGLPGWDSKGIHPENTAEDL